MMWTSHGGGARRENTKQQQQQKKTQQCGSLARSQINWREENGYKTGQGQRRPQAAGRRNSLWSWTENHLQSAEEPETLQNLRYHPCVSLQQHRANLLSPGNKIRDYSGPDLVKARGYSGPGLTKRRDYSGPSLTKSRNYSGPDLTEPRGYSGPSLIEPRGYLDQAWLIQGIILDQA